jgi:hypothetical protein
VRRATAVINLTLGVARRDAKRHADISAAENIRPGRCKEAACDVVQNRLPHRFASGGFQPQSQALAFRRGWFTYNPSTGVRMRIIIVPAISLVWPIIGLGRAIQGRSERFGRVWAISSAMILVHFKLG